LVNVSILKQVIIKPSTTGTKTAKNVGISRC